MSKSKKGSTYTNRKTGEVKKRSDFKRGEALGRAKGIMYSRNLFRMQKQGKKK